MRETVFVLIRSGAYRSDCGGIFSSLDLAKSARLKLHKKEPDNYHKFLIYECKINELATTGYDPQDPEKEWYTFEFRSPFKEVVGKL